MKSILTRLKLIEHLDVKYQIEKSRFINHFKEKVNKADLDLFADSNEQLTSEKNPFMGEVTNDGFKIKLRNLDNEKDFQNFTIASGTFSHIGNNTLLIKTEVNGLNGFMIPFIIISILINGGVLIGVLRADKIGGDYPELALPFSLLFIVLWFGSLFLMMRPGMRRTKEALVKEFDSIGLK